jgi:hypothetical protein
MTNEAEVIAQANKLGRNALSESGIEEYWHVCINLINRVDDLVVFNAQYDVVTQEGIDKCLDLGEKLTAQAKIIKNELIRRRDCGEFVSYR